MEHAEMVALIQAGVERDGGTWADLGAGTGNFTRALAGLAGPQATIYAVDRSAGALAALRARSSSATIRTMAGDFTRPLELPPLDGILMANALHFVREQAPVLASLVQHLRPGGRLLLVEYQLRDPVSYVPYPVPFERFQLHARDAGLSAPTLIGSRRSPSSGVEMYAAVALLAAKPG